MATTGTILKSAYFSLFIFKCVKLLNFFMCVFLFFSFIVSMFEKKIINSFN